MAATTLLLLLEASQAYHLPPHALLLGPGNGTVQAAMTV